MRDTGGDQQRSVLLAFRSAVALHRLLDVLPVFEGDGRISRWFTLVPGSRFDLEALAALDRSGARVIDFEQATGRPFDLILTTSPKGALASLSGRARALLPHGAGFNKALHEEGSPELPSGLDPAFLLSDGAPWADLHGLGHAEQVSRLAEFCPPAATRAVVVGDPTLDRMLESGPRREAYRSALDLGDRTLLAVLSTWGPESLLTQRPGLPGELVLGLPVDGYRVALLVHPNEVGGRSRLDLAEQFRPELRAGLLLPSPHQDWAAVLVAADAVITDHGSTALYAAALGRPVLNAYDGGRELIAGTPMARLLAAAPRFTGPESVRDVSAPAPADAADAFDRPGEALTLLRAELYRLLDLTPPRRAVPAEPLPVPSVPRSAAPALAVHAEVAGGRVRVERFPAATERPIHHLSAEHPAASLAQVRSAAVLWRRPGSGRWTVAGWTAHVLAELPSCVTAAAVLSADRCVLRHRQRGLLAVQLAPGRAGGRVHRVDPTAAVSAVHAWLGTRPAAEWPVQLDCVLGPFTARLTVRPARAEELDAEL
ncbi:translation initiation factor 2 [Kitasatospora sp. CB01950]|uniref:translation initiation factor 2 n=1 Tax=Kitasatospora sp. CB01950 TaxID=1703930 RepID=UPI00094016C6|nr:translation initiation factor 2 [Kitasatospora sp. CB01950]OKJ15772.1 translation initiation factor 2 [Kitasatospora sp. CB01950]